MRYIRNNCRILGLEEKENQLHEFWIEVITWIEFVHMKGLETVITQSRIFANIVIQHSAEKEKECTDF